MQNSLARVVGGALAALALTCSPAVAADQLAVVTPDVKVLDLARVIPSGQSAQVLQRIDTLEREQGWRVRVYTTYQQDVGPSVEELRAAWKPDQQTVVMLVDISSPNIMSFRYGDAVVTHLRRPFFTELQSRYGNQFYVRDNGESAAVMNALTDLTTCLGIETGCVVVPGLPADQYYFTLVTSIAGGFVFGFASQLEPAGFVQRRWVWLLIFFPLWGTLFINFGLGPIVTRTSDPMPVLGNLAGFAVAAAVVKLSPMFASKMQE